MKRRLILILFLLICSLYHAAAQIPVTFLTKDSLTMAGYSLDNNWLLKEADDTAFAQMNYDDSKWKVTKNSKLTTNLTGNKRYVFSGKGWLRQHIYIDSSLSDIQLALRLKHYGASEIYVDGKKARTYGIINDKDHTINHDPNSLPLVVSLPPGPHTIAVRYANYNALWNYKAYNEPDAGFVMTIGVANWAIDDMYFSTTINITLTIFVFTFFFSFFLLHLFLFLYNKKEKANLFFSIFCLAFGTIFLAPYLRSTLTSPFASLIVYHVVLISAATSCMSLSGFLNELFGKRNLRFTIIAMLSLASVVLWFFYHTAGAVVCFILVAIVCIEAVVLIIRALIKRVKGAYMVGVGILFIALSFLITIIIGISSQTGIDLGNEMGVILLFIILSIPVSMSIFLSWNYSNVNKNLAVQLQQVEELSAKNMEQELEKQHLLEHQKENLEKEVAQRTSELVAQKQKSDDLLLNILPEEVAEELKEKGTSAAKYFDHVSVLFTDFVDFTKAGERLTPQQLVDELHACFKKFDEICAKYNIEKIKTIGDAYLAVSGLPMSDKQHAINIAKAAIEIRDFIAERKLAQPDTSFNIRIGIHSGSVVAGIVGVKKFAYDIWGDTVNTAARMEQSSESGKINVSEFTYELIKEQFSCSFRGKITAKNKGEMNMYFVEGEL